MTILYSSIWILKRIDSSLDGEQTTCIRERLLQSSLGRQRTEGQQGEGYAVNPFSTAEERSDEFAHSKFMMHRDWSIYLSSPKPVFYRQGQVLGLRMQGQSSAMTSGEHAERNRHLHRFSQFIQ